MPILVQICIAVGTVAFIALVVALIGAITQLRSTAAQVERTMGSLDRALPEIERAIADSRGVIASVGQVAHRVDQLSSEFAATGHRIARASSMVVDEVIDPATKVAALVRGVRTGASFLIGSYLKRRGASSATAQPGGNHHE